VKLFAKKKALALLAAGVVAIVVSVGAYAYFTSTSSGSGTATVGTSSALTLHATVSGNELYPGDATGDTVSFTVDNPSNGKQQLGTISLASIDVDSGHSACPHVIGTDFSMADVTVNTSYAPGSGQSVTPTGTLKMLDDGNQDSCKGATLTLHFSS
jgi:predicted ribosomally synthesized peptide with SipW-like signal peptide